MKKHVLAYGIAIVAAIATAGCIGFEHTSTLTGPTPTTATGVAALIGTWTSASTNIIPSPSSCTNFKWTATEQTGTSAKGNFTATCAGDLAVNGVAEGALSGATTVTWKANGTASSPALPSCAISLTGTAELGTDSIRVPYTGTTCVGPVSGVEVLQRH